MTSLPTTTWRWPMTTGGISDKLWKQYRDFMNFGYPIASSLLCLVGTMTNSASMFYFIKKQDKTLGDKLLMLLNSMDLLLCIFALAISILQSSMFGGGLSQDENALIAYYSICIFYILMVDGTAYATCLLSVTRTIRIASPFYQVKGKLLVKTGIIVFIVMEAASAAIAILAPGSRVLGYPIKMNYLITRIVTTSLLILVVVSATVIAVYKLTREDLQGGEGRVSRNNRKATWTVVILSTLFFFFNSILLAITAFVLHSIIHKVDRLVSMFIALYGATFVAIPLNSAINPIVYLVRKRDMRLFFTQGFQSMFQFGQRDTS